MGSKKALLLFLIICLAFSCNNKLKAPDNMQIFAKHIVFNDSLTSVITDTSDALEFTKKTEAHFVFKLSDKIYKSEFSLILYPNGTLHRLYKYCEDELEIYSKNQLDTIEIDGAEISIKLSKRGDQIIDVRDTFDIEKIFPKEKLILVKQQPYNKRIIFYEYKENGYDTLPKNAPDWK
ncbi:MAG: hypothetical protein KA210_02285 [Bacteroidia bacterium]|nr:hypothetical protein [Bacteroidia bacterium]